MAGHVRDGQGLQEAHPPADRLVQGERLAHHTPLEGPRDLHLVSLARASAPRLASPLRGEGGRGPHVGWLHLVISMVCML